MRTILTLLKLMIFHTISAQYYYKDILGTKESNQIFDKYQTLKVRSVAITSFEEDGTKSENFICEQVFTPSTRSLKTNTKSGVSDESVLISYYDENGLLTQTIDSSSNIVSKSIYLYNEDKSLHSLKNISTETTKQLSEISEHHWYYDAQGRPLKMLRTTNVIDTILIEFIRDDSTNIVEERSYKKGTLYSTVYYYYDAENRLTDIVRYNPKVKKLLPDFMFEYSESNQIIQKITVPANNSNYQIWRYQYNTNGLRIKEALYDKNKKLTGKIEYQYRYG